LTAALPSPAPGQVSQAIRKHVPLLETYESNTIGWTNDSDDVGFLDINLSLKYPIMPARTREFLENSRVYFAASTRFAQYLGTRSSSPVIGKRFNPKLIWRQVTSWHGKGLNAGKTCGKTDGTDGCDYLDFAFAHESNGQSVSTARQFEIQAAAERVARAEEDFARDYLSRGWDYLELAGRKWLGESGKFRLDSSFKHFLRRGPLQGKAEDFFDFEDDPEVKHRRRVHGLALYGTWQPSPDTRIALGFETGGSRPLRYTTVRVEWNTEFAELPVMLFYQQGYGSDLTLFYKRVSSVGVALALSTF
jgi:hypothetical protein